MRFPALFQNYCFVLCIVYFVLFYVLFVCKCVLPPGDNPIAVNKYIKRARASAELYISDPKLMSQVRTVREIVCA